MTINRKGSGKALSIPLGIFWGGLCSITITALGAGLVAYLINNETLPMEYIGYGSLFILLIASAAGAGTAVGLIKHRRMQVCAISALIYYLSLLSVNAIFFGGQYSGMGVTAMVIMAGSVAVALLGTNSRNKRRRPVHPSR